MVAGIIELTKLKVYYRDTSFLIIYHNYLFISIIFFCVYQIRTTFLYVLSRHIFLIRIDKKVKLNNYVVDVLQSKELSNSECGMGVRAPDSLPGLGRHYPQCL